MDNIILFSTKDLTLEKIQSLIKTKRLNFENKNVLHYGDYSSFITFISGDNDEDMFSEHSKVQKAIVTSYIPNPSIFVIDTNNFNLLKALLLELSKTEKLLIDNNFNRIMKISEFEKFLNFKELFK